MNPARQAVPYTSALVALALGLLLVMSCNSGSSGSGGPAAETPRSASPPPSSPADETAPAAEDVATVVDWLLQQIRDSGLTFIRNGDEHTAAEAADHIRDKYDTFRNSIKTPEDFIRTAASSSMLTGRPYLVKLRDGTTRPLADWLRELLAAHHAVGTP